MVEALGLLEAAVGAEHPRLATTLHHLAEVELAEGRAADAVPLLERAIRIRTRAGDATARAASEDALERARQAIASSDLRIERRRPRRSP